MIIYILKFSSCLALFLAFYKLVLEKENMHVFKRFYLLGTLLLSIGIPLITFTYYVEPSDEIFPQITQNIPLQKIAIPLEPQINYMPIILWASYGLGVLLFGVNFLRNLYDLNYKIKHNPKQKNNRITNVLLKDLVIPHTFFNYIFLNKRKFETHKIPKEVFWHEETHAIQKHSIDVLLIEILQIVFWFNPLIYFIKHVVKLNHEFLADQAVLKKGVETATYQETLLAFSSNAMHPQLANAINYSSIKKRFTVMKTQTTKKAIWLRSLILLPLLAFTLYSFSSTQIIEKEITTETNPTISQDKIIDYIRNQPKSIWINIMKDGSLNLNEIGRISLKSLGKNLEKLNSHLNLTLDEKKEKIDATIQIDYDTDLKILLKVKEILTAYGVKKITIKESAWENTNPDNPSRITEKYTSETPSKIAKFKIGEEIMDVIDMPLDNLGTKKINGKTIYFITADGKTSYWDEHRTPVDENGIEIKLNTEKQQKKATKEQVAEYNAIVKRLNSQPEGKRIIKQKDVERIEYIYGLMNAEQKKNAQPFPKLVSIAPPPMDTLYTYNRLAKRVQTISKNRKANIIYLKKIYSEMSDAKKSQVPSPETILKKVPPAPEAPKVNQPDLPPPPPPILPKNVTPEQKRKYKEGYKDAQVASKVLRLKAQKEQLVKVRELRTNEERKKLKIERLAHREAQVAARVLKSKALKEQLVKVRELRANEDREKLKAERLVHREAQVASKVLKLKAQKEQLIKVREIRLKEDKKRSKEEKKAYKKARAKEKLLKNKSKKKDN